VCGTKINTSKRQTITDNRLLENYTEAVAACRIDINKTANEWQKEVQTNANWLSITAGRSRRQLSRS